MRVYKRVGSNEIIIQKDYSDNGATYFSLFADRSNAGKFLDLKLKFGIVFSSPQDAMYFFTWLSFSDLGIIYDQFKQKLLILFKENEKLFLDGTQ